jgi:histidine triad (HIT) family protein
MSECVFCRIIKGEIPSHMVFEDEEFFAFRDINPVSPVHFLVIPKRHIPSLMETGPVDTVLLGRLLSLARELAVREGLGEKGCRFVINCKGDGGQTVDHLHLHVAGGRPFAWPPG